MNSGFLEALSAEGPAADQADKMTLYGRLIGSWDLMVSRFGRDGSVRLMPGEWHFGWVLEGRAIQDVWIVPKRAALPQGGKPRAQFYGVTLRTYDPQIDAWKIQYTDPVSRTSSTMIGRTEGDEIVQISSNGDGSALRWSFRDIMPDSFLWRGEVSIKGEPWRKTMEFAARRMTT